jgi:hypothetical protein
LKKIVFLLFFCSFYSSAQDYVDLVKVGYGQTFNNNFKGTTSSTEVKLFDLDLTYPLALSENNVLVTGVIFSNDNLQLIPDDEYTNLYSTTLKLGVATNWSKKWSTTVVLLPKVASDYENITSDDFYMGGFAMLKLQPEKVEGKENRTLIYRFGIYATNEAFGFYSTPIIGWYYFSPNSRFEMDVSLPLLADVNYKLSFATIGFDYSGIGGSFNITKEDAPDVYVDLSSLEFASYIQFNTLNNTALIRAKVGYASSGYEVYAQGDKIDWGLTAFSFGDDRTQLNPEIEGGIFLKIEAIYRFHIKDKQKKVPLEEK